MDDDTLARRLTPAARDDWAALGRSTTTAEVFRAGAVAGLPEPVARWLRHAVAEGTPLARSVALRMHGEIRIGRWVPFTAEQRMSVPAGFVWAARARVMGLPVTGFDRWTRGEGEMRWRLLGAVPVMSASGEDVSRSAAGRHAGELLVALPTAALAPEVSWREHGPDSAIAQLRIGDAAHEITLRVSPDGALGELGMRRWGPAGSGSFELQPFGAIFSGERRFGGLTVPRRVTAGWHHGTDRWADGQFIRYTVDDVVVP